MLAARHHYTLASCVSPTSGIVSPLPSVIISCCPRKVLAYCHQKFLYTTTNCSCPSSMTLTNIWSGPLSCVPFYHYLQSSDVEAKSIGRFPKLLSLELDEEQVAALQLVPEKLHPNLKCLIPVLDSIRKAYSNVVPPHRKALPVNNNLSLIIRLY